MLINWAFIAFVWTGTVSDTGISYNPPEFYSDHMEKKDDCAKMAESFMKAEDQLNHDKPYIAQARCVQVMSDDTATEVKE